MAFDVPVSIKDPNTNETSNKDFEKMEIKSKYTNVKKQKANGKGNKNKIYLHTKLLSKARKRHDDGNTAKLNNGIAANIAPSRAGSPVLRRQMRRIVDVCHPNG